MAGPTRQTTNTVIIPPGEGRQTYSSVDLAWYVENLELDDDRNLKSVVGPSTLRIGREAYHFEGSPPNEQTIQNVNPEVDPGFGWMPWVKINARAHSIFCANLLNGSAHTTIYRFGQKLYRFTGNQQNDDLDEVLVSDLSSLVNPKFPDQYVRIGNNIVWTNGVDRPRIIQFNGSVFELGYSRAAETPALSGPSQPDFDETPQYFPNSVGYSWRGRIGTPGDVLTGREGALLNGSWLYFVQYEDLFGNLSAFSSSSEPIAIHSNQADPFQSINSDGKGETVETRTGFQCTEIDDLTRRFLVRSGGDAPEQTVAIRLFRTADTKYTDNTPRFLARIPGAGQFAYDDNKSDSELGVPWTETVETPVFHIACAHQGRLIVGNISGDPGAVRQSVPGLPGTFNKEEIIYPDAGGAEITGLVSHNGVLLAFTESAVYQISADFKSPQPLSQGVGCVAPRSIAALPDGTLMWLGRDGFYGMRRIGDIKRLSTPIDKAFKLDVNPSRMHMAVASIDAESKEYRCALAPSGDNDNKLMFCYDGAYWRRQTLGIHIADMCGTKDFRQYTLAIGSDPREVKTPFKVNKTVISAETGEEVPKEWLVGRANRVFVLNRQTTDYFGPARRIRYRSSWILAAESGLVPTNVRTLYVGLKDAWNGLATVRVFKNGSWKPVSEVKDLVLVGPDDESGLVEDTAGAANYDESRVHAPRLFWRSVPVDLHNVSSWAFEIELFGWPGALNPLGVNANLAYLQEVRSQAQALFDSNFDYEEAVRALIEMPDDPLASDGELGRLRLAAFAFDSSVATLGSPLGRVPKRKDQ